MARLTSRGRKRMKAKQFALPGKRFPIPDASHARNALARAANLPPAERQKVRRKVKARFPGIAVSGLGRGTRKKKG
jgi:hypothetical protein